MHGGGAAIVRPQCGAREHFDASLTDFKGRALRK
jgi:hypothetical protein